MHHKCLFCRRKYSWSGVYEKHLRNKHTNLDIVLASTIQCCSTPINNDNEKTDFVVGCVLGERVSQATTKL